MKHKNGYWIDLNGNRWSDCISESEAQKNSESLKGCINCCDCSACRACHACRGCRDCRGCQTCRGYISNPHRYVTSKIGSRNDNTTFYYGETEIGMSLQVVCGCFRGDLEEFEKAVLKTHANDEEYKIQYLREIKKVKILFELEENEVESLNKNGKGEIMKGE